MGSKGSSTQNTQSNQTYNPAGLDYFKNALQTAQGAAAQPFQSYSAPLVAGLSPTQQAGISGVNANANFAQPYINEAANYARAGAQSPIGNISQFFNPFTQNVVDATQRQFDAGNQVQQSQLLGNARAQSGVGGDRIAIAQSELAKQQHLAQDPAIAGLYSQNFNQALAAAQQYQQAQARAGFGIGSLGTAGQNAALTGAGAQLQAGGLQQGTQQAGLSADYGQFMRQLGYAPQMSQFLTQAVAGLAPSLGGTQQGTSNTTSTPAQPSILGQIAGLGMLAAGAYTGNPALMSAGAGSAGGGKGSSGGGKGSTGITGNTSTPFGSSAPGATLSYMGGTPYPMFGDGGAVHGYAGGGSVAGLGLLDHILPMARAIRAHMNGGAVLDAHRGSDGVFAIPGFALGGEPDDMSPAARVSDAFGGVYDALNSGEMDPQGANYLSPEAPTAPIAGMVPLPRPRPAGAPGMAMAEDDALPPEAQPTAGFALPGGAPQGGLTSEFAPALREAIGSLTAPRPQPGFAGSPGAALLAAGLGTLASGSPWPGVAIGQGGLRGVQTMEGQRKAEREEADAAARQTSLRGNLAAHGVSAQQAAERLFQSATQHAAALAETTRHHGAVEGLTKEQRDLQAMTPISIGTTKEGFDIKAVRDPKSGDYRVIDATGKILPLGEGLPGAAKPPGTYIDPATGKPIPQGEANADGIIPANAQLVSSSVPVDYSADAPYIEKGMDVPKPAPVAGKSTTAIQTDAESYLQTGKLPPVARGKSPVAVQQNNYRNAVQNYAGALAESRGLKPEQTAEMWRTAPGMLRFILGADGRSTVALGTAVRHLDTVQELAKAWAANDTQAVNRIRAVISRQFGSEAATNLEASGRIVGPEIIKALGVAGAGTEHDRNTASEMFSAARSPAQLKGAVDTVQKLLAGQLEGRKRQAANAGVSEERFKNLIGDRPYEILTNVEKGGAGGPTATPKKGDRFQFKQGWGVFDGKEWKPE